MPVDDDRQATLPAPDAEEPVRGEVAAPRAPWWWARLRRDRLSILGMALVGGLVLVAAMAPWLAPFPDHGGPVVRFERAHERPSRAHPFGTDEAGRDILSRVVLGSRISLVMSVSVIGLALLLGIPLGLVAGYREGWGGMTIMRVAEVFLAIPPLVLALAAAAALPPALWTSMIAISLAWWPWYTRLVYGEVLRVKQEVFVEASRAMGVPRWRIAVMDILPHVLPPVIVKASLDLGFVILLAASLSFLGLGAQPPAPDWGTMVAKARTYLPANWWGVAFPGAAIAVAVLGFNLLGDALRDLFDVEMERERWIG